jgi:hypothetical protein
MAEGPIRTPDQRLRVFVSSTLQELAPERAAARDAIRRLRLWPVVFESGARPHPAKDLYRAYLAQSQVFVGIYWESYGWVAPDMEISGLEDEYGLAASHPKLIYIKRPAPKREPRLGDLLQRIRDDDGVSYKQFSSPEELQELVENDLALMLTERFAGAPGRDSAEIHAQVPAPLTRFFDRQHELEEVVQRLMQPETRLITLVGPGGVGKSRLAIEAAKRISSQPDDRTVFVPLASVEDQSLILATIARALDVREASERPLVDAIADRVRDRPTILLLDNFEHLVEGAMSLTVDSARDQP